MILNESWFLEVLNAFEHLPFSEDRYIILHDHAKQHYPEFAKHAIEAIVRKSDSFFWLLKAGERARLLNENEMAKRAAKKIKETTRNYKLPNYMPVKYPNPAQQITPEHAKAWSSKTIAQL